MDDFLQGLGFLLDPLRLSMLALLQDLKTTVQGLLLIWVVFGEWLHSSHHSIKLIEQTLCLSLE